MVFKTLFPGTSQLVNDIPQNFVMPMNTSGLPFRTHIHGGGNYFRWSYVSCSFLLMVTQYEAPTFGSTDATTGEWKIKQILV